MRGELNDDGSVLLTPESGSGERLTVDANTGADIDQGIAYLALRSDSGLAAFLRGAGRVERAGFLVVVAVE